MTILSPDFSLSGGATYTVTASMSGFDDGEAIRIKGALYKEGSSNYFGYTYDGKTWVKNSAATQEQPQVLIGQWKGTLDIKNDYLDSGFAGDGNYLFKIRFYYGTNGSDWSENAVNVSLVAPTPTITPSPSPTETPKPSISPTPEISPTIMPSPTLRPAQILHKSPTRSVLAGTVSGILGITAELPVDPPVPESSGTPDIRSGAREAANLGVGIGAVCAGIATVISFRQSRVWKKEHERHP